MSNYYEACPRCGHNLVPAHGTYQMPCPPETRTQPAEDERVKEIATDALDEVLQFPHTSDPETYKVARAQLAALKASLLPVQPATCPKCGHSETDASGWCMSGRPYIANEPDSNKRSICSCRCVQPAASTPTEPCRLGEPLMHGPQTYRWCATHNQLMLTCNAVAAASTEARDERKIDNA